MIRRLLPSLFAVVVLSVGTIASATEAEGTWIAEGSLADHGTDLVDGAIMVLHVETSFPAISTYATTIGHLAAVNSTHTFAFVPDITCLDETHSVSASFAFDRSQYAPDGSPTTSGHQTAVLLTGPRWGNLGPIKPDAFYHVPGFTRFTMKIMTDGEPREDNRCKDTVEGWMAQKRQFDKRS